MTLIELLSTFSYNYKLYGETQAVKMLWDVCTSIELNEHIINSVNDNGDIVGALNEQFEIVKLESVID